MSGNNSIVATYGKASLAEADLRHLREMGFDRGKLALLGDGQHGGGLNGLDRALYDCIPPEDLAAYEAELHAGRVVLIAHGTAEEIARAKRFLDGAHPTSWDESADSTVYYGCVD